VPRASRVSGLRDLFLAFALVGVLLGGMFAYSGVWPPMVIVESGSMMHPQDSVPYGRFGTIDPGDIIIVKAIDGRGGVETWADGGDLRYGKPGDALVFYAYNRTDSTPIIHRAIAWVDVVDQPDGSTVYQMHWVDGEILEFGPSGIYFPELGFDESAGFTPQNAYQPLASGWITQGDNPRTNDRADQANANRENRLTDLVQPGWVIGVARGEIPWFGLLKLVFSPDFNQVNPPTSWMRVGNAFAPYDMWTMLAFCILLVILTPLAYDVVRTARDRREAQRDLERDRARRKKEDADEPPAYALDDP
jgi:signal peptidase I